MRQSEAIATKERCHDADPPPCPQRPRRHDDFGVPRSEGRTHEGVDCFSPAGRGTPLVAVESGTVRYARPVDDLCGSGNRVSILGDSGYRYYYGHLDQISLQIGEATGQRVTKGQVIGTMGDTGNANTACGGGGVHLHFEIAVGTSGDPFDPYPHVSTWPHVGSTPPPSAPGVPDGFQPIGDVNDAFAAGSGQIGIWGWTADPDSPSTPIDIHIYVWDSSGTKHGPYVVTADDPRRELNNVYPGYGNNHGWEAVLGGFPTGTTTVQAFAIDSSNTPDDYQSLGVNTINVS